MDGVRKWIGSQPLSTRRTPGYRDVRKPEVSDNKTGSTVELDHNSTEYIVTHLMDPSVPDHEIAEYKG